MSRLPPNRPLTDEERYPMLSEAGRRMLQRIREHPHAPRFNHQCGDRLNAPALARVRAFAEALREHPAGWAWDRVPEWVIQFAQSALVRVPFYRKYGPWPGAFTALPTTSRADLSRAPWDFVPDDEPLEDLIVYDTSGTTGHRLIIPSHPECAAKYLPLLEAALATRGIRLEGGPDRVALVQVCAQKRTWTFGNITSYLDEAGFAKINLDPDAWKDPADRVAFLDDCNPQVYTGDPVSFQALAELPLKTRPRGMLSSATALFPRVRQELEAHFGCPVIDYYSMTESAGPIAVQTERGHEVLPHDVYVEILDPDGRPCPPGVRGEIALTGGRNPYLPLLRYRTGDFASMDFEGRRPTLVGIEGRQPIVFIRPDGTPVNSIDVTWVLRDLYLTRFTLHQHADGTLTFRARPDPDAEAVRTALHSLFGPDQEIHVEELPDAAGGKVIQYSRDDE